MQLTLDLLCLGLLSIAFALHLWFDKVAASQSKIDFAMQVGLSPNLLSLNWLSPTLIEP